MKIELHRTSYRPLLPHKKTVRVYGEITGTATAIFWLWWVITLEARQP